MSEEKSDERKSFWSSAPGLITALATLITALTGLFVALNGKQATNSASPVSASPSAVSPTRAPVSAPLVKAGVQTVLIKSSSMVSRGFFTPKGYIIAATHTLAGDSQVTVSWVSDGKEYQFPARVVKRRGLVDAEAALLEVLDAPRVPREVPIGFCGSLKAGDQAERYFGPGDTATGTVVEVYGQRKVGGLDGAKAGVDRWLVTTRITSPGDSGAPVIDARGKIIAMIFGGSRSESISVPIEDIKTSFPEAF